MADERNDRMKRKIVANCLVILAMVFLGCETKLTDDFHSDAERGFIRCGFEGGKTMDDPDEDRVDTRCDVTEVGKDYCCALKLGGADNHCGTLEWCEQKKEDIGGIIWVSECDDPDDCYMKYADAGVQPVYADKGLRPNDWVCCTLYQPGAYWNRCMHKDDCTETTEGMHPTCLATWHCPTGQVCIENTVNPHAHFCDYVDETENAEKDDGNGSPDTSVEEVVEVEHPDPDDAEFSCWAKNPYAPRDSSNCWRYKKGEVADLAEAQKLCEESYLMFSEGTLVVKEAEAREGGCGEFVKQGNGVSGYCVCWNGKIVWSLGTIQGMDDCDPVLQTSSAWGCITGLDLTDQPTGDGRYVCQIE